MDCLNNVIGIRQACAGGGLPAPRFGLYIEDFPGLTKTSLQAIEPGVWLNCQAWLNDLVRQAWTTIVEVDARAALEPYLKDRASLEFGMLGVFDETATYQVGQAGARGLRVKKNAGILAKLAVSRVWIHAQDAGTFTLTVTDGKNPASFDVTVTAGEAEGVWVHYETERDVIDITIADALFKPANGDTKSSSLFASCTSCNGSSSYKMMVGRGLNLGVEADPMEGIAAQCGIVCAVEPAVCILAPRLKIPLFYAVVLKVLETWEASSRMNFFAQHKAEWVKATHEHVAKNLYPQAWDLHAKGLAAFASKLDTVCVECGTGTRAGYGTP